MREEVTMDTSSYCIFAKMPDGNYCCIDELSNLEAAQMELMLLEADRPGDYFMLNSFTGKLVQGIPWTPYVC
jgi:hypothetical protein